MSLAMPLDTARTGSPVRLDARALAARTPLLWWGGWALLLAALPTLVAITLDDRLFNGISVWIKPAKFMVSAGVHLLTLALCAAWWPLPQARGRLKGLEWVALLTALFEVVYITWRASRGEASHFNLATPFSQLMYSLMGIGAVALTGCAGVMGWTFWRAGDRSAASRDRLLHTGVVLGLMLGWLLGTVSGAWVGGSSTGHWVGGTPSDAGGLPLLGWSRDGGDLRVAHFFGLHAMQALPLFAAALWRFGPASTVQARGWLLTGAALYTALTVAVFVQAVSGQPLV